jgi:metal-responsive CopG/Arc/MetJ family transcriptional regulator
MGKQKSLLPGSTAKAGWQNVLVRMPSHLVQTVDDIYNWHGYTSRTEFINAAVSMHANRIMKGKPIGKTKRKQKML